MQIGQVKKKEGDIETVETHESEEEYALPDLKEIFYEKENPSTT